jgi:hypothetical protein
MYTLEKNLIGANFVIKVLLAKEQKQVTKEVIWDLSVQNRLAKVHSFLKQCTEVRFVSFLPGGFTTMAVKIPPERKLAKCTSV